MPGDKQDRILKKQNQCQRWKCTVAQLESHLSALCMAVQQQQRQCDNARNAELLLAEAILQHKVMYQVVRPIQTAWLQQTGGSHSNQRNLQSQLRSMPQVPADVQALLQLAVTTNPLLQSVMLASPDQVRVFVSLTVDELRHRAMAAFEKVLLLSEELSEHRYPPALVAPASSQQDTWSDDSCSTPARDVPSGPQTSLQEPAFVKEAAAKLLRCLQEYKQQVQYMLMVAGLQLLHSPHVLLTVCDMNLATGQHATPQLSHFLMAARRLKLTSKQVQHLQLLLQQYNRMTRQQRSVGQRLVSLSEHSFSLQASLSISASCQQNGPQPAAAAAGSSSWPYAQGMELRKPINMNMDIPSSAGSNGHQLPQLDDVAISGEGLEQLLQQHVRSRLDMLRLMQVWALCTLTPWQIGELVLASWPYHAFSCTLVELSPFLVPDDTPRLHINGDACEEAAQAAALADELGFTGAHHFMQQRCEALEAQLQWVLQREVQGHV